MIPKIIHYCWFGRKPLPKSALKCIASWRKYMPDYEIKEWNEDNYDVNVIPYTKEAYEAKKYAFVSDYARFWILYNYGGIYFDTDVEVIRPMSDIIEKGPFMGFEASGVSDKGLSVAPGLGLGVNPGLGLYAEFLDLYSTLKFRNADGTIGGNTIVGYTTDVLLRHGLDTSGILQQVAGVWIYPKDVFCPMDHTTGITTITSRTVSIHHYDASWINHHTWRYRLHQLKNVLYSIVGERIARLLNSLFH